jgi:hypothetical protein
MSVTFEPPQTEEPRAKITVLGDHYLREETYTAITDDFGLSDWRFEEQHVTEPLFVSLDFV